MAARPLLDADASGRARVSRMHGDHPGRAGAVPLESFESNRSARSMMLRPALRMSPANFLSDDYECYIVASLQAGLYSARRAEGVPPISLTILAMQSSSAGATLWISVSRGHWCAAPPQFTA